MRMLNLRWLLAGGILFLGLAAIGGALLLATPRTGAAPVIGGPFSLTAQDGRTVTQASFAGAPYLVFFGYTYCPDVCPTTLQDISQIFAKLGKDRRIAAAFVTVDPERDTQAMMQDFLASFDPRIVALGGSAAALAPVYKAFRVYLKKIPGSNGDYTMDHTALVYLMDKQGNFIASFNTAQSPEEGAKELARYF